MSHGFVSLKQHGHILLCNAYNIGCKELLEFMTLKRKIPRLCLFVMMIAPFHIIQYISDILLTPVRIPTLLGKKHGGMMSYMVLQRRRTYTK